MARKKGGGPPRGGGLGDIGQALREAGVLKEKDAKRIAHQERVRKKEVGRKGGEAEKQARKQEIEANRREQQDRTEAAQKRHENENQAAFLARLVKQGTVVTAGRGKRFYFVARSGKVPFVEVNDDTTRQLVDGRAGIVEVPGESRLRHVVIVGRDRLESLRTADSELVRFWNQS